VNASEVVERGGIERSEMVGVEVGARERINFKMELAPVRGRRRTKRCSGGHKERGKGRILMRSKSILLFLARAGSNSVYLFFLD
jgi:hypothetical protein